jgi:hypothetical protein
MNSQSVKTFFAIHEVVVLTGFSKYMLDYLARDGIFEPSLPPPEERRRGVRRKYSYQDVVLLRALYSICDGSGKIRHLKEALTAFRKAFGHITPEHEIAKHLVVQGSELCVTDERGTIKQLRDGQLTLTLVVGLSEARDEIATKMRYSPNSGGYKLTPKIAAAAAAERQKVWQPIKGRRLAMRRAR